MKDVLKSAVILLSFSTILACNANNKTNTSDLAYNQVTIETTLKEDSPEIKVALLLDTSNSMDGLIDQAKAQLWQIVNELSYA